MLIEMNVTQPLPKDVTMQDPSGKVFTQKIEYDLMPVYCPECLMVGHKCLSKEKKAIYIEPIAGKIWQRKGLQEQKAEQVNIQSQEFPALQPKVLKQVSE